MSRSKSMKALIAALAPLALVVVGTPTASADPVDDAFLVALDNANIMMTNPGDAVALGQSVCPMLAQPGQTAADAASSVANTAGMPLGPATMFTGLAITAFCPQVMSAFGSGQQLPALPLDLFGGF